jgi:aminopeptidase N
MLRNLLGERAWWRSMNTYLQRHKTQGVETADLLDAIQDATGRNMRPFFDQWVFKAGHPEYKFRYWWDARAKKANVRILQIHGTNDETGLFAMPITFAFRNGDHENRFTEVIDKKDQFFSFPLSQQPDLVLFDPDHIILKRTDFVKPEAMWVTQLMQDPHVIGRIHAAHALARLGSPKAVGSLALALVQDKFWGVQVEVAGALGKLGLNSSMEALLQGLKQVSHPKVRRAIFDALGEYTDPRVLNEIKSVFQREESYFAEAAAIRALGRQREPSLLSMFKELLKEESWNDIIRNAALDAIAALKLPESVDILIKYTHHYPSSVRIAAIRNLGTLGSGREQVLTHLLNRLDQDRYLMVKMAAIRALGSFADERATDTLMKYTSGDWDGRLKRTAEEAIRKIRKGMDPEFPQGGKEGKEGRERK